MAKSSFLQNNFTSGELSELIKGRTDIDQYFKGMQLAENVVTVPQGGVKRRMGTEFISHAPIMVDEITSYAFTTMPNNANTGEYPYLYNDNLQAQVSTTATVTGADYVVWTTTINATTTKKYVDLFQLQRQCVRFVLIPMDGREAQHHLCQSVAFDQLIQ